MSQDTKKHIGVGNVLYLYIFKTKGCWETWQEGHWGMLEKPKKTSFEATRVAQKNMMGVRKINVLVNEN